MEIFYCEICNQHIKNKSKSKHLKSKSRIEVIKSDHIILSSKDVYIDETDEAYSLYMIEHNKKYDFCKVKCQYNLVFDDGQHTEFITARLFDKRTRIWWKEFLIGNISGFSNICQNMIMLVK